MKKYQFDPSQIVGNNILVYDRESLCRFIIKLCERVKADAGAGVYRGGVYPENISENKDGELAVGPASRADWQGQELDFLPPEQYWNNKLTPAADVYSIGMLLYYAVSGGKLPFEGECRDPQLRRMSGDPFDVPKAAGRRLGDIIRKATQFKAADRYQSMDELRALVESCLKNLYLGGATSAESIFKKHDDDLNDLERMMVSIIEKGEEEPLPEEEILSQVPEEEEELPQLQVEDYLPEDERPEKEEPDEFELEEEFVDALEEDRVYEAEFARFAAREAANRVPRLYEERYPDLEPVVLKNSADMRPAVQYSKNAQQRMRMEDDDVENRRRRPVAILLVLCALLVVAAIVFNAIIKDITSRPEMNQEQIVQQQLQQPINVMEITPAPTMEPVPDATPLPGGLEETTVPPVVEPVEPSYELFKEDISWSDARDKCFELGGHLAVINDEEEFAGIVALAEENGVSMLWIGGRRENDKMIWEDGSDQAYTPWAAGEPSYQDSSDGVLEDYVLLWYNNGWFFNDSRHDPCAEFPQWYGGKMAYICEFGG